MAYYRNYRNYPQYQKKEKTYKSYLHLSYKEICDREKYFLERYDKFKNIKVKFEKHFKKYNEYITKTVEFHKKLKKEFEKNKILKAAIYERDGYRDKLHKIESTLIKHLFYKSEIKTISKKIKDAEVIIDNQDKKRLLKLFAFRKKNFVKMPSSFKESFDYQIGKKTVTFEIDSELDNVNFDKFRNQWHGASDSYYLYEWKYGWKESDDERYLLIYDLEDKSFKGIVEEVKTYAEMSQIEEYLKPIQKAKGIIEKRHKEQQSQIKRAKDETAKHKAHSYAYQEKTRELAEEIKREIKSQLRKFKVCPYCEGELGEVPHADHIYPVSKGGLSTKENMVYICQSCNSSKSDKTLNVFIKSKGFDRDKVEGNLDLLGKDY